MERPKRRLSAFDDDKRIRGARKGAGWISGVRLELEPAPAVRVDRIKDMIVTAPEHRFG